ncbi:MAG: SGNH/GDSL hydrolase family protein [Alphaproteobacteria bacterium]
MAFEKASPRRRGRAIAGVALLFVACLAATEFYLATEAGSGGRETVFLGEKPAGGARHVRLREWQPRTTYLAPPPEIRRRNPGPTGARVADFYRLETDDEGYIRPVGTGGDGGLTLAFLGGSTTECLYVLPEGRLHAVAGATLAAALERPVAALNGAKSGNNALHSLHLLTGKMLSRRPDAVIVMHNINDLAALARLGTYWNGDGSLSPLIAEKTGAGAAFKALRDALIPHTYRAFKRLTRSPAREAEPAPPTAAQAPLGLQAGELHRWAHDFERALRQLVRVAQSWDSRAVLVTQVVAHGDAWGGRAGQGDYLAPGRLARQGFTPESFRAAHDRFNEIIRRVAAEEEAYLVDLAAGEGWDASLVYDRLHFTDAGARRAGRAIAEALIPAFHARPPDNE